MPWTAPAGACRGASNGRPPRLWLDDLDPGNASKMLAVVGNDVSELAVLHAESVVCVDEIDILMDVGIKCEEDPGALVALQVRRVQNFFHLFGNFRLLQLA